jgi:hypothetical protein
VLDGDGVDHRTPLDRGVVPQWPAVDPEALPTVLDVASAVVDGSGAEPDRRIEGLPARAVAGVDGVGREQVVEDLAEDDVAWAELGERAIRDAEWQLFGRAVLVDLEDATDSVGGQHPQLVDELHGAPDGEAGTSVPVGGSGLPGPDEDVASERVRTASGRVAAVAVGHRGLRPPAGRR